MVKIPQGDQLALAFFKSLRKQPFACGLHQLHCKLILPARRIYADAPGAKHIQPIAQKLKRRRSRLVKNFPCKRIKPLVCLPLHVPEPDTLQLCILVFETEIDMSRAGA